MSISSISSSLPTPREPERSKSGKTSPDKSSAASLASEAATTKGLVSEIGARMAELEKSRELVDSRVEEVLNEVRDGTLLSRQNIEQAAQGMLFGEDPEAVPLD